MPADLANSPAAAKFHNDCSSGKSYANATTALWVATGALAAAGVVSFVIGDRQAAQGQGAQRQRHAPVAARGAGLLDARRRPHRRVRVLNGIHFLDVGPRRGDAVILIHGLTATHRYWKQNIDALAERRRVIALDLPGFGRSHKPDADYSIDYFVGALFALLDGLGVERASLVGNSMGGHIAMAAALHAPGRVDKLVLVDPAGVHPLPSWLLRAGAVAVGAATEATRRLPTPRVPRPLLDLLFRAVFPTRRDLKERYVAAYTRAIASSEYELHLRSALRAAHGVMRRPMQRRIGAISAPTLIMWGARDYLLPVTAARQIHRLIPRARLSSIRSPATVRWSTSPTAGTRTYWRF